MAATNRDITATPTRGDLMVVGTTEERIARLHFPGDSKTRPYAESGYFARVDGQWLGPSDSPDAGTVPGVLLRKRAPLVRS